jgi:hypothetical protein
MEDLRVRVPHLNGYVPLAALLRNEGRSWVVAELLIQSRPTVNNILLMLMLLMSQLLLLRLLKADRPLHGRIGNINLLNWVWKEASGIGVGQGAVFNQAHVVDLLLLLLVDWVEGGTWVLVLYLLLLLGLGGRPAQLFLLELGMCLCFGITVLLLLLRRVPYVLLMLVSLGSLCLFQMLNES